MAMRPCARTGVQVQSTGGGSGLPKLLARWTVGGEEGRGQRGGGGGAPSFIGLSTAHFLLIACILWARCLALETYLLPFLHPPNTHSSFKDYFSSTSDVFGTVNNSSGSCFHSHS